MIRSKRSWQDLSERMPLDVMPASNGEHVPPPPTREQIAIMRLQEEAGEQVRRRLGMSRRDFVRSAAALSVGLWAIEMVSTRGARAAASPTTAACDLDNPNAQLANLPGEFVFDIQTHHVDEDGLWKVTNPGFHAFFIAVWPQAGCGELDRTECLGRYHYIKEVYLDSSTSMGVLSAVPSSPDRNPLPTQEAAETVQLVNQLAASQRAVMHKFVMPNRGHGWATQAAGKDPLFLQQELDDMAAAAAQWPFLRAWKCYTPWGDVPNASGWFHDDPAGRRMIEHAIALGVPTIATHKGFALPSFDQRSAACRDIGVAARDYPAARFVVYHSGYDNESQGAYPGDAVASSTARGVNGLVKALRENGWSARHFAPGGTPGAPGTAGDGDPAAHANSHNVFAEIGSTWRGVMSSQTQAAHLLGKLIYYVGPKRVVWGTDSLWYGSPQAEIARLREFPRPSETVAIDILASTYRLPWGLEGDVDDPSVKATDPRRTIRNGIFGRNAAVPYGVDPDAAINKISCDELQRLRDEGYLAGAEGRERRPLVANEMPAYRTRRELFANVWPNRPWAP